MAAPVVIDMGLSEPPAVLVASMVEACRKAVADGECHLVRDAPQGPYRAIAILTWDGPDKVRIEVGLRREAGTEWRTRALTFQPEDVELERFRSVGFVVGTLASEEELPPPPLEVPKAAVKSPKAPQYAPPASPPQEPRAPIARSIGLVGTVGGALDEGAPRYGVAARGRFGVAPWIGVAASLGGSLRPKDAHALTLQFLDAGLGVGLVLAPPSPVGWELSLEAVLEHFRAEAASAGESDARTRTLPAARAELDFIWAVAPPVEILVGGSVFARPGSTTIAVEGEAVGSTGVVEVGLSAGARLAL